MKNFIFTLIFLTATLGIANGQGCNDLIVTEIVFGNVGNSFSGEITQFNHSVEIFNPTDLPIDLANYNIELLPETGEKTVIELEGIVPPEGTFVISNVTANAGISTVSDVLDLLLSFEGKVAIQLSKTTGEVVDKVGRQGIQTSSTTIDFTALLNDPNYLNTLDINLGSIENLLIRRKRSVQKGKQEFENEDFLKEWVIYPNFAIDDLGNHINACLVPVLSWEGVSVFTQEDERLETDEFNPVFGSIISTESLSDDVTIFIENVASEYVPGDPQANSFDFNTPIDPNDDVVLDAGTSGVSLELLTTIADGIPEGDEGTGFQFDIVNANGTGATVEFNGDLFDIKIKELPTSTSEIGFSSKITVYPSIVSDKLSIDSEIPTLEITNIRLVAFNGKNISDFPVSGGNSITIDVSTVSSSGYHLLYIQTNKGTTVKKIFKL